MKFRIVTLLFAFLIQEMQAQIVINPPLCSSKRCISSGGCINGPCNRQAIKPKHIPQKTKSVKIRQPYKIPAQIKKQHTSCFGIPKSSIPKSSIPKSSIPKSSIPKSSISK